MWLTVVVLSPALLHEVLLLQRERLRRRQLLQLRTLHPLMIPAKTGQSPDTGRAFYPSGASNAPPDGLFLAVQISKLYIYVIFLIAGTQFYPGLILPLFSCLSPFVILHFNKVYVTLFLSFALKSTIKGTLLFLAMNNNRQSEFSYKRVTLVDVRTDSVSCYLGTWFLL